MSQAERPYYRIAIEATLTIESALHCGNGDNLESSEWKSENSPGDKGVINTVCKDRLKMPYIPASTLRGSLRELCEKDELKRELFGCADNDKRKAGKLRLYDAKWISTPDDKSDYFQHTVSKTSLHDGIKIDPITNTAADKQLFTHEIVPTGSQFALRIEGDNISKDELNNIIGLVQTWDGGAASSIGKGKSRGWGKIKTINLKPKIIDSDCLAIWLKGPSEEALPWKVISVSSPAVQHEHSKKLTYCIQLESPLLINEKKRVEKKKDNNHPADFEFMRYENGQAYIPGSTIRGAVRAHAARILRTIAHTQYEIEACDAARVIQPLIDELFGATGKRSLLWFEDVIAENTATHQQTFNAIDRFTGGVADTALYKANALAPTSLKGVCYLDTHPKRQLEGDWWKGLLLLLIRDFMEGDLYLGWGKAKGYGQGRISALLYRETEINNFSELKKALGDSINETLVLLHKRLKKCLEEDK